ncbi:hypothetical protein LZ30DRAFT_49307 [Colletotrichum cereale]|nr:hypothetical protein LZ30DRAFT_49307 [Colletotrichum cereale]
MTAKRYFAPDDSKSVHGVLLRSMRRGIATPRSYVTYDRLVCGLSSSSPLAAPIGLSVTSTAEPDGGRRLAPSNSSQMHTVSTRPHDVRYPRPTRRLWIQSARDGGDRVLYATRRSTAPAGGSHGGCPGRPRESRLLSLTPTSRRLHDNCALQEEDQHYRSSSVCHSATL